MDIDARQWIDFCDWLMLFQLMAAYHGFVNAWMDTTALRIRNVNVKQVV